MCHASLGKYFDPSLGVSQNREIVQLTLSTGILRDLVDIHDNRSVEQQVAKFIDVYGLGKDWKCIADSWALPWTFYWQALYKKINPEESD